MPFECSIACRTWEVFATFLEFCVSREAPVGRLLQYLDDYLFGGQAEKQSMCMHNVCFFMIK